MTYGTLPDEATPVTRWHRLDVRLKIVLTIGALVVVLSEPTGSLRPFPAYFLLLLALLATARVPPARLLRRSLTVAPIVLAAAALVMLGGRGGSDHALSLLLRAAVAVGLLTLLVSIERVESILAGMGSLGLPRLFGTLAAFIYRYGLLLSEEAARTERARRSRSPRPLRQGRVRIIGRQAAMVFIRGWKRSQRVHQAMLARGFTGSFPQGMRPRPAAGDAVLLLVSLGAFLAVRIWYP